jgi:antitoxin Phd
MAHRIPQKRQTPTKQEPSLSQPWQLQAAKAQFSEVFRRARERTPQVVTRQGKEAVVIVALEDFERLTRRDRQPKCLSRFFAESPFSSLSVDLERKPDDGRKIEL